jgi:hypothetical protein
MTSLTKVWVLPMTKRSLFVVCASFGLTMFAILCALFLLMVYKAAKQLEFLVMTLSVLVIISLVTAWVLRPKKRPRVHG